MSTMICSASSDELTSHSSRVSRFGRCRVCLGWCETRDGKTVWQAGPQVCVCCLSSDTHSHLHTRHKTLTGYLSTMVTFFQEIDCLIRKWPDRCSTTCQQSNTSSPEFRIKFWHVKTRSHSKLFHSALIEPVVFLKLWNNTIQLNWLHSEVKKKRVTLKRFPVEFIASSSTTKLHMGDAIQSPANGFTLIYSSLKCAKKCSNVPQRKTRRL